MTKQVLVPDEKGRGFARAIRAGQFLFISGMTGQWDLATWELDPKAVRDVVYQTRRIFEWAQQVLAKCGLTLKDVVSTTTFLRSMKDLESVSRVKREFIPILAEGSAQRGAIRPLLFWRCTLLALGDNHIS